jgi:hypothetical protein
MERPILITTWSRNCIVGLISVDDKDDDKQLKKATNKGKKKSIKARKKETNTEMRSNVF